MTDTKSILKEVRKIEIKTKHLVEGLLQGAYHSIFKGRGIEFSEVREYVPGDDIRTIDWNVTARTNKPHVKEFIEERDLTAFILLDVSASNDFGSEKSKKQASIELAASLMFAAIRNNDRIGLCLFTDSVERFIPPRKGKKHALSLIREMIEYMPKSRSTDLKQPISFISKVIKKKCIIFIISDFFSGDFKKELRILKKKHDVVAINMNDIREKDIPDIGFIELEDEETGEQLLIDTSDPEFRKNYAVLVEKKDNEIRTLLKRLRVDMVQLKSDESFDVPLKRFFKLRERRIVR